MRLWSIHPKYLDAKGLVALWREGLLARAVLRGQTKGYRHHPQLDRFRRHPDPHAAIGAYLHAVLQEANRRGYAFNARKVPAVTQVESIVVTRGQVAYEADHLLAKLKRRDPQRWLVLCEQKRWALHPIMRRRAGGVEAWEKA